LHRRKKIDIDDASLRQIARSGMGSMRDAQSNFDQVISFSGEKISIADVTNALGIASAEMLTRVIGAISDRKPSVVLDVVAELISRGQDTRNFCRDLLGVFRDLMVFKVSNGDTGLVENSALNPDDLNDYSSRFTEADFVRFFNSLCETETKLKEAVQPRYVLETGLVKLTEMRRVVAVEQLLERLTQLESMLSNGALDKLPHPTRCGDRGKKNSKFQTVVPEEVFEPVESFPSEPEYFSPDPYLERRIFT
jgi:DNA polymerase-3 subunit gamma/tau